MFRRGTTTKERGPSERTQPYGDVKQERPVSEQREAPASAPPRGNGQAVREPERMVGREEMVQPVPITFGQYLANWFTLLVGSALVLAETVLGLRLFFKLVSADNTNGFVKLIYHITGQMIRPFDGVFSIHTVTGGGIFEPAVVIGMVLFLIGAVLAMWIVRSLASIGLWGRRMAWR
jgi:hypothetical protein